MTFGKMSPLARYAPDADPTEPGVLTEVTSLVPVIKGFAGSPSGVVATVANALPAALPNWCFGAAQLVVATTSKRFAGTATKLYSMNTSGEWSDVSRSAGGGYNGQAGWMFVSFGNIAIASQDNDEMQQMDVTAASLFSNIANTPKPAILVSAQGFLVGFNTHADPIGTYESIGDRWWCSGYLAHTLWTPDVTTQCTTGRIVEGAGGTITAAAVLGEAIVAFKAGAMYLGTYVGAPVVWQWDLITAEVGCVGKYALCVAEKRLYFVGELGLFVFDGARVEPLGLGEVSQFFLDTLNNTSSLRNDTKLLYEPATRLLRVYFPSESIVSSPALCDVCLVLNIATGKWGRDDRSIEHVMPGYRARSGIKSAGATATAAVFDSSHQLLSLHGASAGGSFTTGDLGDEAVVSFVKGAQARFLTGPTAATLTPYHRALLAGSLTTGATVNRKADGTFEFKQSNKWHRFKVTFTGDAIVSAIRIDSVANGKK